MPDAVALNQPPPSVSRRSRRGRLVRALIVLSLSYVLVVVLAMIGENYLVFHPTAYPGGNWRPVGLSVEDAHFMAADGTALHGWYIAHPNPRVHLLYAEGNAGNLSYRYDYLMQLFQLRASVLIFDYRGYGKSHGAPTEAGILMDARAARAWLANKAGVAERNIVLFGESIGGGVMVDLAAEDGARGVVLQSTFTSACDVGMRVPVASSPLVDADKARFAGENSALRRAAVADAWRRGHDRADRAGTKAPRGRAGPEKGLRDGEENGAQLPVAGGIYGAARSILRSSHGEAAACAG